MAIKKKVVKKETAKPSKKVSKKPTPKPVKKKAAPRGNPVQKASISTMIVQIIENPIKGIGASVSINIQGDKTALIAGIIATMNEKSDFRSFIERIVAAYLQNESEKNKKKKK